MNEPTELQLAVISDIQCPGCVGGCAPAEQCEVFEFSDEYGFKCKAHVAGTMILPSTGSVNLGLPKGFDRVGCAFPHGVPEENRTDNIRLWESQNEMKWDKFNVPVWAMETDDYLYVRTYLPRTYRTYVDVSKGDRLSDLPEITMPIDVGEFVAEID